MDTVFQSFILACRILKIPVSPDDLIRQFSLDGVSCSIQELQRASNSLGIKQRLVNFSSGILRLDMPCPAVITFENNTSCVIVKAVVIEESEQFVVVFSDQQSPNQLTKTQLLALNPTKCLFLQQGVKEKLREKFDIRWFIPALKKYKKLFYEVLLASFFLQLFALITPFFFQVVMDKVLVHRGFTTLDVLAIGFLAVAIFDVILGGIRQYLLMHTTNRVDVELGAKLYRHLVGLPMNFFANRQVGQTVARVRELDSIREFITGSALTLLIDVAFTIVFFIVLYYYSPLLTAIVAGSLPFYILLSLYITPILRNRLNQKFAYGAENQAFLTESINGIETVKSMAVEPQMQRKWENQLSNFVTASFRSGHLSNIANQGAGFISKVVTLLIIWVGAHLVIAGAMTVGQLIAFNMIAGRVSAPILKIVQLWQDFQQAAISVKRLGDILNTPTEPGYDPNRTTLPSIAGKVEFDNISFRYSPNGQDILSGVNLNVSAGESVGIVGRSGSGKSTLSKLIQRLYVPTQGQVKIDGIDLSMVDTGWLRRHIGVVLQNNMLFTGTIRENIALANPAASIDDIVNVSKMAGAHDFIVELSEGYDNQVGEQGSNLSGGQRQRIAIARALLTNPNILIFDEATSALDYESEHIIQQNMAQIKQGRTTFIIAHRLSTVRQCDRIIVVDKGRIVEQGTHDSLIALNGYYAKLNAQQAPTPKQKKITIVRQTSNSKVS
ncbi:type I secretion system permease/ATPase [Alteromonas sp. A081]|uniref:type I secretion system permease/ATPase n=1 Tax=Alteromonas sp. A081 TaxID=3410269 RepID=UPI003B985B9C